MAAHVPRLKSGEFETRTVRRNSLLVYDLHFWCRATVICPRDPNLDSSEGGSNRADSDELVSPIEDVAVFERDLVATISRAGGGCCGVASNDLARTVGVGARRCGAIGSSRLHSVSRCGRRLDRRRCHEASRLDAGRWRAAHRCSATMRARWCSGVTVRLAARQVIVLPRILPRLRPAAARVAADRARTNGKRTPVSSR